MQVVELPIESLRAPEWNSNQMTFQMRDHLRRSIERFDLVVPLVVRMDSVDYQRLGQPLSHLPAASSDAIGSRQKVGQAFHHVGLPY